MAILTGMKWNLKVVSTFIFLVAKNIEQLKCLVVCSSAFENSSGKFELYSVIYAQWALSNPDVKTNRNAKKTKEVGQMKIVFNVCSKTNLVSLKH